MHHFIAEPIYSKNGELYAVEILTRFTHLKSSQDREVFFAKMSVIDKLSIFIEQVDAIRKNAGFFLENNILCSLNIDYKSFRALCGYHYLAKDILSTPYLRVEINEASTSLQITHLHSLLWNEGYTCLEEFIWLDDFCNERFSAGLYNLWGGVINFVKIDRSLFTQKKLQ